MRIAELGRFAVASVLNVMKSVLLVAERATPIHQSVNRALMLARYLRLPLDILLCDAALANAPRPEQTPPHALEEARQYVEALRASVSALDVVIAIHAAFDRPPHELVAHHARTEGAALIVKSSNLRRTAQEIRVDWQLSRSVPAPLLLTQGQPWHPRARFAAAIDVKDQHRTQRPRAAASMASLRIACGADLDLLYAQPPMLQLGEGAKRPAPRRLLQLAKELSIGSKQIQILSGEATEVLPAFAAAQEYDVVAVEQCRDGSFPGYLHSLSARLLQSFQGDVLVVNTGHAALSEVHADAHA